MGRRRIDYARQNRREAMGRSWSSNVSGGTVEAAKHLAAAMAVVPIEDPVFDETMRRAAEHRQKRAHLKDMAAKLKAMREQHQ